MRGSGSSKFSGAAGNTSGFSKPTKTSVFNQTTQPNSKLFGSTVAAPVFGQSGQKPTAHPKLEGSNAGGTSLLFRTPTVTSVSTGGSFGQQNASTGGNTRGGFFASSNSNTSFGQLKPVGTTLAQQSSNKFDASQTSTAGTGTGIFGASTSDVMIKIQLFAAPQTNIFGSTAPSTFGTHTTRFNQTVFAQPNQNNIFYQNKPAFGFRWTQTTDFGFGTNTSTNEHGRFGSKPSNTGFQMTTSAFDTNNTFGATSTAQPATGDLFGFKVLNKAPSTSLFNQTINHLTGL